MSRSRRPRESLLTRAPTAEATSPERRTSENDCPKTRFIIGWKLASAARRVEVQIIVLSTKRTEATAPGPPTLRRRAPRTRCVRQLDRAGRSAPGLAVRRADRRDHPRDH